MFIFRFIVRDRWSLENSYINRLPYTHLHEGTEGVSGIIVEEVVPRCSRRSPGPKSVV